MTTSQNERVADIGVCGEDACTDEDFRFLTRRLNKAFCTED